MPAKTAEPAAKRGRPSKDPEGLAMAKAAMAMAPKRASEFNSQDGRDWLDCFELGGVANGFVVVKRTLEPKAEARYRVKQLADFAIRRQPNPELRRLLAAMSKGLMPSSARLAILMLAAVAAQQKQPVKKAAAKKPAAAKPVKKAA